MDAGAFIMHRCHGSTTDVTPDATRAVTKMKATITQRFNLDGAEVDAESDCRFCFFWEKQSSGDWQARFVRHWYEKVSTSLKKTSWCVVHSPTFQDKLIPVNPSIVPKLDHEKLNGYPSGYRYLAYCQEKTMGVKVLLDLPGHRRENGATGGSAVCGAKHDTLYLQCKAWLEGQEVDV